MARFLILAVLAVACVFPSVALAARDVKSAKTKFVVQGRVFCDSCQAGFETLASTYIQGATVRVECRSKTTRAKTCSIEGKTDHTGTYNIEVAGEHEHENCESVIVDSPVLGCNKGLPGRERAPVFLTHNNGIASSTRFANALGFWKDSPLSTCAELMKTYEQYGD